MKINIKDITITHLKYEDKEEIDFIIGYLSETWFMKKSEIENGMVKKALKNTDLPYILIARHKNTFAGMIMLFVEEKGYLKINNQPWIWGLFVKEKFRNNGIGRQLTESVKKLAKKHGFPYLYLDTANSKNYYKKLGGWDEIGTDHWERGNEQLTIMRSRL